jgi:carboxyl-terminal processing protease
MVSFICQNFIDFEKKDGRDAGKDIALEVSRLKKLESTVLFLTYVMMVVDRCQQLWILLDYSLNKVPIVQIKSAGIRKEVLYDQRKIEWDGPLVIMVNSFQHQHQKFLQQPYKIIKEV